MRRLALGFLICLLGAACATGSDGVELRASSVEWTTYAYELSQFGTVLSDSFDGETLVQREFDTWILENEFLQVTLLPEFGGRILSIVSKTTGHEQLYQNPVGLPYQIGTGVFYYDWLMVYGGIFPTFPEPEHGKTWFLPWKFAVVEESPERVTVSMSFSDDVDFPFTPRQYDGDATGLTLTYLVTLEAGRAAVDTTVIIENPTDTGVDFEYWTNATLAPGSPPGETTAGGGAEIIAPIETITIPSFWSEIAATESPTPEPGVFRFDLLRTFRNWPHMGIAYAHPDASDGTFWGVIDQDRGEGIFRIADNRVTPGLKIWTWGYDDSTAEEPDEARPYVELWAGLTPAFFEKAHLEAGGSISFDETFAPTVGISTVSAASHDVLVAADRTGGSLRIHVYALEPGSELTATVEVDGAIVDEVDLATSADAPTTMTSSATGATARLVIRDGAGTVIFDALLDVEESS